MNKLNTLYEKICLKEAFEEEKNVIKNNSFMSLRKPFESLGYKVDFSTSPIPYYTLKKNGKTYNVANKKYVDDADFVIGSTAFGKE